MTQTATFEDDMQQLQEILNQMERGELPLDQAMTAFEEGNKLIKRCREKLAQTELQIEKIMAADGTVAPMTIEEKE